MLDFKFSKIQFSSHGFNLLIYLILEYADHQKSGNSKTCLNLDFPYTFYTLYFLKRNEAVHTKSENE